MQMPTVIASKLDGDFNREEGIESLTAHPQLLSTTCKNLQTMSQIHFVFVPNPFVFTCSCKCYRKMKYGILGLWVVYVANF